MTDWDRVVKALSLYLFYTKTIYRLHGATVQHEAPKYNQIGNGWALRMTHENYSKWDRPRNIAMVLVGDIPYRLNVPVFIESIKDFPITNVCTPKNKREGYNFHFFKFFITALPYYEWELSVPIGSVDLSAAREDLQYTSKTISTLLVQMYIMYNEYMEGVMIELTHNNSLLDACQRYTQFYGGHMKHHLLSKLRWVKESLPFDGRKSLANTSSVEIYSYYLDKVYGQETKDILRKDIISGLTLGHLIKAVIVKQDTEYKNYGKFLKFYMKRENDKYNLKAIVVKEEDWDKLNPWVLDSFDQLDMSRLVEFYREHNPNLGKAKRGKGSVSARVEFRCFSFANEIKRDRADGFGCLFTEGVADIEPDDEHYYISEAEVLEAGFDFTANQSEMLRFLRAYLKTKGIPYSRLYYTKRTTRNFNSDNWISLMDLMKTDKRIYDRTEVTFIKESFTYFLCKSQFKALVEYKIKDLVHKRGRYADALLTYAMAEKYHNDQVKNGRHNFACLTDGVYRSMVNRSNSRYNMFNLTNLDWISTNEKIIDEINKVVLNIDMLFKDFPMMKYVNYHYDDTCEVGKEDFLYYISIIEEYRGETEIKREVPKKDTSSGYGMRELISYFQS